MLIISYNEVIQGAQIEKITKYVYRLFLELF